MADSFLPACEGRSAEKKVSLKTTVMYSSLRTISYTGKVFHEGAQIEYE